MGEIILWDKIAVFLRNSAFCVLLHECIHKCQFLKELFATKWVIAYYGWWMGRGMWLCKGRGFFSTSFHPFSKGEVNVVFTLSVLCSGLVIQPSWGKTIDHIWLRNVHLVQYIVNRYVCLESSNKSNKSIFWGKNEIV